MGLITGAWKHPKIDNVEITVDEKEKGNMREPWEIVTLDINFATIQSPQDLIDLGQWLVEVGAEIPMKYTSTGKERKKPLKKGRK